MNVNRVCVLQFPIRTGDLAGNRSRAGRLLSRVAGSADHPVLVVLPELWATGFAGPELVSLADRTPELLAWLSREASARHLLIAGSLPEANPEGLPWNTLYLVDGKGVRGRYRKQHLFTFWGEERWFSPGTVPAPLVLPRLLAGPLVCYDLRFPELARAHGFAGAELLIVSAQWPLARLDHWRILLQARAVENQCPVVAANGCGQGGEAELAGHSLVIAADGSVLAEAGGEEACLCVDLDPDRTRKVRARFCSMAERPWPGRDRHKVVSRTRLLERLAPMRARGSRIVFTNGCFDLLHPGHVSYLEQARQQGDLLVVGLNSDRSVRSLKGPERPINSERDRARVLAALGCVDFVTIFDQETPLELIRAVRPQVLVKGADWPEEKIVGAAEVRAQGGRVERIPCTHRCSTTALIASIRHQKEATMTTIKVEGMKCRHCAGNASKALEELGLTNVRVDLDKGEISYDGQVAMEEIRAAISAKGYKVVE